MLGWPYRGRRGGGGLLRGVCFRSLEKDTHTLFFFSPLLLLPSHKTKLGVSLTDIQSKKKKNREKKRSLVPPVSSYPGKPAIHQFAEASYLDQHGVCLNMVTLDKVME